MLELRLVLDRTVTAFLVGMDILNEQTTNVYFIEEDPKTYKETMEFINNSNF